MGWLIATAIILLLLIILTVKLSVRVKLRDDVSLTLGIGIFKKKLFPSKEKEARLSDYKIGKFRKNKDRQTEKSKRKSQKKKKVGKETKTKTKGTANEDNSERDITALISKLLEVVKVFLSRFGHHLRINVRRVHIIVASEDAATTAVLYGAVCGALQCLFEFLYNCLHLTLPKREEMQVIPDFASEKIKAEIDITFSFRLWQVFDILLRSGWAYIKQNLNK